MRTMFYSCCCVPLCIYFLILEPYSSWCVPKAISPVTMNLQCQQSTQQQTWVLRRRWGSAPGRCIGPWAVAHFVWRTNTDEWPCSTRGEKFFCFTIAKEVSICAIQRENEPDNLTSLRQFTWVMCSEGKAALRTVLLSLNYLRFDLRHYGRRHTVRPGGVLKHL